MNRRRRSWFSFSFSFSDSDFSSSDSTSLIPGSSSTTGSYPLNPFFTARCNAFAREAFSLNSSASRSLLNTAISSRCDANVSCNISLFSFRTRFLCPANSLASIASTTCNKPSASLNRFVRISSRRFP